jgi:hypothetical protein
MSWHHTRTYDRLVALIGKNGADNYISWCDTEQGQAHATVVASLEALTTERDRLAERCARDERLAEDNEKLRAEVGRLSAETERAADEDAERYRLRAEVAAMRPVVEAAERMRDKRQGRDRWARAAFAVEHAVDAYRASKPTEPSAQPKSDAEPAYDRFCLPPVNAASEAVVDRIVADNRQIGTVKKHLKSDAELHDYSIQPEIVDALLEQYREDYPPLPHEESDLHAAEAHPEWEYLATHVRVGGVVREYDPSGGGWERNTARSSVGYWMRRKPARKETVKLPDLTDATLIVHPPTEVEEQERTLARITKIAAEVLDHPETKLLRSFDVAEEIAQRVVGALRDDK